MTKSKVTLKYFNSKQGLDRGVGKLKEVLWYFTKMFFFTTIFPFPVSFKCFLLKIFGAKVGNNIVIKPRVNIHMPWKLEIGDDVWIGEEAFLLNFEKLEIGNNVCISQRVFLCGGNHDYKDPCMPYRNGRIIIKDGAWIGASCFVSPSVTIGTDCVVTACSVVRRDLPENTICEGNPANPIKNRW